MTKIHEFTFTLKNRKYCVEVDKKKTCYVLYRVDDYGYKTKIPCFTDAEEKAFPVVAGYVATAFLAGLKKGAR